MANSSSKSAFLWNAVGKFFQQGFSLVVNLLLARLLTPEIFGLVGVLSVFLLLSTILIQSGFRDALLKNKTNTSLAYSSVFYYNVAFSILLYVMLFFLAPFIATFYHEPILTPLSRWLFLGIVINSISIVHTVIIEKDLNFKKLTKVTFYSGLISGLLAVYMAFSGYGIWTLVVYSLLSQFLRTFLLWFTSGWKPQFKYSHSTIKEMIPFSYKLLLSGLFANISANISQVLIGKFYSIADVGFYDRALKLRDMPLTVFSGIINEVSYPLLVKQDLNRKQLLKNLIKFNSFFSACLFFALITTAKPIVLFLLSEKWLPLVVYFQLFCLPAIVFPLSVLNSNMLKINNLSGVILKNESIRNVILICILFFFYKMGVLYLVIGICVLNVLYPFKMFYDLDKRVYKGIFKHYLFSVLEFSSIGFLACYVTNVISVNYSYLWLEIIGKLCIYLGVFVSVLIVFRKKSLKQLIHFIRKKQ